MSSTSQAREGGDIGVKVVGIINPANDKTVCVPISKDGNLQLSSLKRAIPRAYGLNFKNKMNELIYSVDFDKKIDAFLPPDGGWGSRLYNVIFKENYLRPKSPYRTVQAKLPGKEDLEKYLYTIIEKNHVRSCVCFIKKNYFSTFFHGIHQKYERGVSIKVYSSDEKICYDTKVISTNKRLDFVILKTIKEMELVGPPLCEYQCTIVNLLLYGRGNKNNQLCTSDGFSHMMQIFEEPKEMGPFMIGTIDVTSGDSGGPVVDGHGLFGMNLGRLSYKQKSQINTNELASTIKRSDDPSPKNYMVITRDLLLAINNDEGREYRKRKRSESPSGDLYL